MQASLEDEYLAALQALNPGGLADYARKLRQNTGNPRGLYDLLVEGRAALMFLRNGWYVEMRDRPDLMLERDGDIIYAEVKHFHRKLQDQLDEQAMNAETQDDLLMPIGDTVDLEGAPAWRQIADVAAKKISQYVENMSTSNNDRGYESPQRYGADQQAIGPRATDQEIQKWISRQHGFVPRALLHCK